MIPFNNNSAFAMQLHTPALTPEAGTVCAPYRWHQKKERVNKWTYNYRMKQWSKTPLQVEIESEPFSKGSCRSAHRMRIEGQPGSYVAKKSLDKTDVRASYEMDVAMQAMCQEFAQRFNALNPPKKVTFLEAFLIERIEVPGVPVMACEAMLQGEFHKFNNNYGYKSDDERNTPQAFSHFTYVASGGQYIVVDVQGTGDANTPDVYTDPQIHAPKLPSTAFGKGNLGMEGVLKFFSTHKCNSICVGLGLSKKLEDFVGTVMGPHRTPQHQLSPVRPLSNPGSASPGSSNPPPHSAKPAAAAKPQPLAGAAAPHIKVNVGPSPISGPSPNVFVNGVPSSNPSISPVNSGGWSSQSPSSAAPLSGIPSASSNGSAGMSPVVGQWCWGPNSSSPNSGNGIVVVSNASIGNPTPAAPVAVPLRPSSLFPTPLAQPSPPSPAPGAPPVVSSNPATPQPHRVSAYGGTPSPHNGDNDDDLALALKLSLEEDERRKAKEKADLELAMRRSQEESATSHSLPAQKPHTAGLSEEEQLALVLQISLHET